MSIRNQRISPIILVSLVIMFLVYFSILFNAQVQLTHKIFLTLLFAAVFVGVMVYETGRINEELKRQ